MCLLHTIVYSCLHTKPYFDTCLTHNPPLCCITSTTTSARLHQPTITPSLYLPHACPSCRESTAQQWRLSQQINTVLRDDAKKRQAEDARMIWDAEFRAKITEKRRAEGERRVMLEVMERVRQAELEEVVRRIREEDEVRRREEAARRKVEMVEGDEATRRVWSAFGVGSIGSGEGVNEAGAWEEEGSRRHVDGLGIFFT